MALYENDEVSSKVTNFLVFLICTNNLRRQLKRNEGSIF